MEGPAISHLFLANDMLIFTRVNPTQVKFLYDIIDKFSRASQATNFGKSVLDFSPKTDEHVKNTITNILGIQRMGLQDKYLGVPMLLQKKKT